MRKTLVSLIALGTAAAVSASAFAQDDTTTATPPAVTPQVEGTPVTLPAQPAALPTPAPVPAPVAEVPPATLPTPTPAPVPAPAVEPIPVPVVEAPPAPPPAPTDPTTIQVLNVVEQVCKPLVQGGDLPSLAKPLGFKKNRDGMWVLSLSKPYQIGVLPPGSNQNVCDIDIMHAVGGDEPLTVGVHNYAIARGFTLYRNDEYTTDLKRHTRSWELTANGKTEALVLVTERKPDGSSVGKNADHSTLMYSIRDAS